MRRQSRKILSTFSACCALAGGAAIAQTLEPLRLIAPLPGQEIVDKKPRIRFAIGVPYAPESLFVTLDGADVTSLLETSADGVAYAPAQVLPAGAHVLAVAVRTRDGLDLTREFRFSTRHTRAFAQFASRAKFGLEAERLADRRDSPAPEPTYNAQGDIGYGLEVGEGRWHTGFESNLWFLNQKLPVTPPPREGLDLASYRLNTTRRGDHHTFSAGLGDVQVNGTNHTLGNLARRGGQLGLSYKNVSLGAFAVSSERLFGFTGGTGIGTDPDTNVYGVSAGVGFLDDKIRLQTVQARGGEPGSSFGLFTQNVNSRGRVAGYLLTARPSPALEIQAEYDHAEFDADAGDGAAAKKDEAYGLRLAGQRNAFNYQLAYEHLGPDYAVVANPVQRDQDSLAASGALNLAAHSLSATALHQFNNVDEASDRLRLTNREWAVDYGYMLNEQWLLGAGYRQSQVASSLEPIGTSAQKTQTSGVTGRVQYASQPWLVSAEVARSEQDDEFIDGNDSEVWTRSISSAYQSPSFSVAPLLSINTTTFPGTGVELEQRNLSLTLNGHAWRERVGYGIALAYNDQQSSDATVDADATNAELRVSYRFGNPRGERGAAVSLRAIRSETKDRVFGNDTEDWTVWLTLSANSALEL